MGVVSRGKGCSGIYTRVKKYLKWITGITKKGKCYGLKSAKGNSDNPEGTEETEETEGSKETGKTEEKRLFQGLSRGTKADIFWVDVKLLRVKSRVKSRF